MKKRRKIVKLPEEIREAREERIRDQLKHIPKSMYDRYLRIINGKSKSQAAAMKCLDCCGWQLQEVAKCEAYGCPLWNVVVAPRKYAEKAPAR